jgi:hypothetical protein
MHRLLNVALLAGFVAVLGGAPAASAQSNQQKSKPAHRPQVIIRDRSLYGPPLPPSSQRNYYGPAPTIQQPMERVPLPAPLAQPPTNR